MATYYIDYSAANDSANGTTKVTPWKRCPGMVGFAGSYSHVAGDTFVFKGGVTWPAASLPWTISYSGTAGNVDTYTVDATWYTGGAWARPIFDGAGGNETNLVNGNGCSYVKIDNLEIINHAAEGGGVGLKSLDLLNFHHLEISYCHIATYEWRPLFLHWDSGTTYTTFSIHHNDFEKNGISISIAAEGSGTNISEIDIHHNLLHDVSPSYTVDGFHGDGIQTWGLSGQVHHLYVHHNKFYGDVVQYGAEYSWMTAWIYMTDHTHDTYIHNNSFTYSNTSNGPLDIGLFNSFVQYNNSAGNASTHYIYNNVFYAPYFPDVSFGAGIINNENSNSDFFYIRNNIFIGAYTAFTTPAVSNFSCDYNTYYNNQWGIANWGGADRTWSYWRTTLGKDSNGSNENPNIDTATLKLTASTPVGATHARDGGQDLGVTYAGDLDGVTRAGAWDMGAYEYGSASPPVGTPVLSVR